MTYKEMANQFADNINGFEPTCSLLSAKDKSHAYRLGRYEGFLAGAEPREKRIEELDKENGKLEGKLADLQSEYIELENFKNNEVKGLKDTLDRIESENVRLIGKLAFTENTLNNREAQLAKAKEIIQTLIESLEVSEGEEAIKESKVFKEIEQFLKEDK